MYVCLCWLCPHSSRSSYTRAMFLLRTAYDLTLPVQTCLYPYSSCSFCPSSSSLEMAMSLLYYVLTKRYSINWIKLTITCSPTIKSIKYCILPQRHCLEDFLLRYTPWKNDEITALYDITNASNEHKNKSHGTIQYHKETNIKIHKRNKYYVNKRHNWNQPTTKSKN